MAEENSNIVHCSRILPLEMLSPEEVYWPIMSNVKFKPT